ncbi:MAG TPA: putative metal-binding protein [Gemmatimonadaceae bacterium]
MNTNDQRGEQELEEEVREDRRELAEVKKLEEQIEEREEEHEDELRRLQHEGKYHLEMVVNGTPVAVEADPDKPLEAAIVAALEKSHNVGQPPDKWILRDQAGADLERNRTPESYGFPSGTRLFLSLDAGIGGNRGIEQYVDPAVTRAKYEAEIAEYRQFEQRYRRRGWLMLRTEFPIVVVGLAAAHLRPAPIVTGVLLDYTNYDAAPPSVRLVNPFTEEPYTAKDVPTPVLQRRDDLAAAAAAASGSAQQLLYAPLMQAATPEEIPFLCITGVREYHEHPAHSGDAWELHRPAGAGKLCRLLEIIFELGVKPLTYGFNLSLVTQITMQPPAAA